MKKSILICLTLITISTTTNASEEIFARCDVKNSDGGRVELVQRDKEKNEDEIELGANFNGFHESFMDSNFGKIFGKAKKVIKKNNDNTFKAKANNETIMINKDTGEGYVSRKDVYGYIFSDTYKVELQNCEFLGLPKESN